MTDKTKRLIQRIEDATGGKVVVSTDDHNRMEHIATLKAPNGGHSLYAGGAYRNCSRAVKALARAVRRRGRAMVKV